MFQNWPMKDTKKYFDEVEIQRWNIKRFFASCPKFRYAFLRFSQATAISEFQNSLKIGFTSWERYLPGTSCVSNISPVLIDNNHSKKLRFLILVKYTMQKTFDYSISDLRLRQNNYLCPLNTQLPHKSPSLHKRLNVSDHRGHLNLISRDY